MLTGRFEHAEAARRASPSVQRFSKDLLGHTARLRNGSCIRRYVRLLVPCRVEPDRKRRSHHQYLVGSAQISDFLPKTLRLSHCVLGRPSRLLRDCRLRLVVPVSPHLDLWIFRYRAAIAFVSEEYEECSLSAAWRLSP